MKIQFNIMYFFGNHDWSHSKKDNKRTCVNCNKVEYASYDPAYGSTNWSKWK